MEEKEKEEEQKYMYGRNRGEGRIGKKVRMVGAHEHLEKLRYCFLHLILLYRREAKASTTAWSVHPNTVNITHHRLTLVLRPFCV